MNTLVSYAHWWAGNLAILLAHAEDAIAEAKGDDRLGSQFLLLSPLLGCQQIRGECLGAMGRIEDALEQLRYVADKARRTQELNVLAWTEGSRVFVNDVAGDRVTAMEHAIRGLEAAEKTGTNFALLFAHAAAGIAFKLNRQWYEAISALERGLAIALETRGHSWEPTLLAPLAEAHLGAGNTERSLSLSQEAIERACRYQTKVFEIRARLTRVRVLFKATRVPPTGEIEDMLGKAETLIVDTGAASWQPVTHELRAALADLQGDQLTRAREAHEAHRLFTVIGAPIRAAEVAKELGL
jgi:tetratricopeptide (TPR) repeat protein